MIYGREEGITKYQEAKKFIEGCTLISSYSDPLQESKIVRDEDGRSWHWWESKLESTEIGWQLTGEGATNDPL